MAAGRTYNYDVFSHVTDRWPDAGDRLLSPGRDSYLPDNAGERRYRMLQGYKRAGDILVQNALSDRLNLHSLVFPALFNYRHYVELTLKAIIEDHGNFAGVELGRSRHELPELWQSFLKIAAAFGCDCSDAATVAVGECISELVELDATSETFRYARNRKGNVPPLPNDRIDLVNLHDVMNGIQNFFECSDMAFTRERELLEEVEQNWS